MVGDSVATSKAKPGVSKIVKLDGTTILMMEVTNGAALPEGEYTVTAITANPAPKDSLTPLDTNVCLFQFIFK